MENPFEAKSQFLKYFNDLKYFNGLKYFNDFKAPIGYSNDMYDIYKNIKEYNPNKKG